MYVMLNKTCHDGFQNDLKRDGESEKMEKSVQNRRRREVYTRERTRSRSKSKLALPKTSRF
jgi:hypothetical protein